MLSTHKKPVRAEIALPKVVQVETINQNASRQHSLVAARQQLTHAKHAYQQLNTQQSSLHTTVAALKLGIFAADVQRLDQDSTLRAYTCMNNLRKLY